MIALAGALTFLAVDTTVRIRSMTQLSAGYGVMVDAPAVDPASPTGYALGRRSLVFRDSGLDTLHWVMQTQAMLAAGAWRIRHVDYDNAPAGRAVHWASPFHWWLALLALADHGLTGVPAGIAVERAALYADPLLLALALLALVPLTARRFGSDAAAILAAGMVVSIPFYQVFAAGYADHHGIAETCGLMTVLFLVAGGAGLARSEAVDAPGPVPTERTLREWLPDRRSARAWFAASAVAGGAGLWVSAASQVPVLVGVGVGAIWGCWLGRKSRLERAWALDPGLWRWWGQVGGATNLAGYLIEYFPAHLTLRLEVNHPLYALAWWGAGELLFRMARRAAGAAPEAGPRETAGWVAGAVAAGLLPAVVLATRQHSFIVADPFVWRLHTHFIAEFQSLTHIPFGPETVANCLPAMLALPVLWLLFGRTIPRGWKVQLALVVTPLALVTGMACLQVRWWGMSDGLLFALVAVMCVMLERPAAGAKARAGWLAACILVLLPGAVTSVAGVRRHADLTPDDVHVLAERDLAQWLRLRAGTDPAVVLSSPVTTTDLIYYGGLTGLGTLYWENQQGLEHAAEIFAAPSVDEARALVRRYGVTHLVLLSWNVFADSYVRLYRGLPPGQPAPANAFIEELLRGDRLPVWLRLLPYRLPEIAALKGQTALVYEVVPDEAPAAAAVHLADYWLETERPDAAVRLEGVLAAHAESFAALTMLAYVQGRAGDAAGFSGTVPRVIANLARADGLDLGDRIRLAFVLAAGDRPDLAEVQLRRVVAGMDERRLRRLTPGTLRDFLVLAGKLGVEIPDPNLRKLSFGLLPPVLRGGS